ncbi:reactive intermediate/imine deaminase [Variovorax boronicumulans]|uniref:Reactive intermediate/imine deaminase n=1 Tax=Variovorax boronicumulans TaxID=436515 RepID=A0AAW8DQG9_9BURK|nr:RidA family protein [Variovorax boronicumulans]MDP9876345.1 reactive intermediate/imine deaminase [Variovorax boronicumulans]MDP9921629.1 reactive intermediate/imine deaminase [Variovorax boronicumulans]
MQLQPKQIHTQPDPYAPFLLSQAIQLGNLVFVSGQAAIGDDGEIVGKGDFDRQAEQAFKNLDRVLRAAGTTLGNVVKVTIFLTSMSHFPKIVELRRQWFSAPYPADTIVEVSGLYSPDAMIEIEAIAVAPGDAQ